MMCMERKEMDELLQERLSLAKERIAQIEEENIADAAFAAFFKKEAKWLSRLFIIEQKVTDGTLYEMNLADLQEQNKQLYSELQKANYETSYANPAYASGELSTEYGPLMAVVHAELRGCIVSVYEGRTEEFVAAAELFLEIANAFTCAWEEEKRLPACEDIRQIFYWYMSDYAELRSERQVYERVTPVMNAAKKTVMESDLTDLRYLYRYGEYVSDCEIRTGIFLYSLPVEKIATMADTFSVGYRLGFLVGK